MRLPRYLLLYFAGLGTDQVESIRRARVARPTHALDRLEPVGVDLEIVEELIVHMKAPDLSDHDASAERQRADRHDLDEFALHVNMRFLDARRPHEVARDGSQARLLELVYLRRKFRRADVHLGRKFLGNDIDDKLLRLPNVVYRVFCRAIAQADHRAEQDRRGIRADPREEAERREITDTRRADAGHEGDGTGHNDTDHQSVDVHVVVLGGVDTHFSIQLFQ